MLIDGHAHLSEIEAVEPVIKRAVSAGISHIVAVGMDISSNRKSIELADRFKGIVFPAIGYHPWYIKNDEIDDTLSFIESHLSNCVALGEVGLDYKIKIKKPLQQDFFKQVLMLAEKQDKPVIIHSRYSHERCHRMVSEAGIKKAVFHWYSGPLEILDRIIADGYYVSATPALAHSPYHQAAIEKAPIERILIETDCPVEYGGKTSEPANLLDTLKALSRLKEKPENLVADITAENTKMVFDLRCDF